MEYSLIHWFIVLFILYLVFRPRLNKSQTEIPKKHNPPNKRSIATPTFAWPDLGNFDFEVVGESHYQAALKKLAGEQDELAAEAALVAHLIPDDLNQFDDKAVRVDINGHTVGFLSRDDARSFRRRLGIKKLTGEVTSCKALITGGNTLKNGEVMSFGVQLDIKPFEN